jgi:predicted HTH domain antitoxin
MVQLTLNVPDDLDLALNVEPGALSRELLVAAAVKLFELGKISSGKAAEVAGVPKPLFLAKLIDVGVSASTLNGKDIAEDIANA